MMWNWTAGCCYEKRLGVDQLLAANISGKSFGHAGYGQQAAQCGTGQWRRWVPCKLNVESGIASAEQWSARSMLGSVAGLSNVVSSF
jgi:hypothetical protein